MAQYTPKELRERLNLSQSEAADAMGISRSYWNEIENGERVPSYKMTYKIARFFKVRIDELVFPAFEYAHRNDKAEGRYSSHATNTA